MTPHRLTFEEARDAWLASSGCLNLRMGGRPLSLFASDNTRRTLYALVDRENLPAVMRTFDFANPDLSIPQRTETTVPQQALFGLNHPFIVQQARALVKDTAATASTDERLRMIYERLFQRKPTPMEAAQAEQFLQVDPNPVPALSDHAKSWSYGHGEWVEKAGRIREFESLPHFTGSAWQGEELWPNASLGWAQLTAQGGHPGNDRLHAVVRRWTAPADGRYDLSSTLIHEPEAGDGIRAFVSHSRLGKLMSTHLHHANTRLDLAAIPFRRGETLEFIVDIGHGLNSDQFLWAPVLRSSQASFIGGGGESSEEVWDAAKDFGEQPRTLLSPWEQLVQVLMLSNEFMFVD